LSIEDQTLTVDFENSIDIELVKLDNGMCTLQFEGLYLSAHPNGTIGFVSHVAKEWEQFRVLSYGEIARWKWKPLLASGGTQIVEREMRETVGTILNRVSISINNFDRSQIDGRPIIVWIHNEPSENYSWLNDSESVKLVAAFVFVSDWQRQKFFEAYTLPIDRCLTIRNAVKTDDFNFKRTLKSDAWRIRCAYISAPYRGLDVLLDSWETLHPTNAELHIWSSRKLWGSGWADDPWEETLFERARSLENVTYHGMAPNSVIRMALRDMDILAYPCTFLETSCISIIEAMVAGLRVVAPSIAVIPETTAGFGRLYPFTADKRIHTKIFRVKTQ
jgi:glycosyltransferase involved in cell wall biosynthesis